MPSYPALIALPLLLVWTISPLSHADARSKAADYLVREQIGRACEGKLGRIASSAVIERDLAGDGESDLIIDHGGITCGVDRRSIHCGVLCEFRLYVRRGHLLRLEEELLGRDVTVGRGPTPSIYWIDHVFQPHSIRWNGRAFR